MAHSRGFEPLTYRLEIGCSIQLSYECVYRKGEMKNKGLEPFCQDKDCVKSDLSA